MDGWMGGWVGASVTRWRAKGRKLSLVGHTVPISSMQFNVVIPFHASQHLTSIRSSLLKSSLIMWVM